MAHSRSWHCQFPLPRDQTLVPNLSPRSKDRDFALGTPTRSYLEHGYYLDVARRVLYKVKPLAKCLTVPMLRGCCIWGARTRLNPLLADLECLKLREVVSQTSSGCEGRQSQGSWTRWENWTNQPVGGVKTCSVHF